MAIATHTAEPTTAGTPRLSAESGGPRRWERRLPGFLVLAMLGCGVTDNVPLPSNVEDPATLQTPSGAIARYRAAIDGFGAGIDGAMTLGGTITDELTALPLAHGLGGPFTAMDSRQDLSGGAAKSLYDRLHRLRAQAREGRGFLLAYAPDSSRALGAHLSAIEGYAELFLADLFCSGIPLSTVDFGGDYTLASGSTTMEVYQHALALFDEALAHASDSARLHHLATVGRGRALLALGRHAEAAAAVMTVPDDYVFQVPFRWTSGSPSGGVRPAVPDSGGLFWFAVGASGERVGALSMGDQEGQIGLAYRSGGDPRTLPWNRTDVTDPTGNVMYFPRKYAPAAPPDDPSGSTPLPISPMTFTVASGVEARLIQAEAALQAGSSTWLTTLNGLRTAGTFDTQPNAGNPAMNDTLWHAGTGGVAGLRPLDDPGSEAARVDLLFRERAFWLYLTAHRQGDLRRLIRDYLRAPAMLYPSGVYFGGSGAYGGEITVPVPESERELNPKYTGCIHRTA